MVELSKIHLSFHEQHHNLSYSFSISSNAAYIYLMSVMNTALGQALLLYRDGSVQQFLLWDLLEVSDPSFQNSKTSSALEEGRVITALTSWFYKLFSTR